MRFEEPKVEFIPIDLEQAVVTYASTCDDGRTCDDGESGGTTYCNTSKSTEECGDPQALTA